MAYLRGSWRSETLEMSTHVTICLPDYPVKPRATVVLLHGLKGCADDWMMNTGLDYFARIYGLAFVMPEVQRSWYNDMAYGVNYFDYVSKELPEILRHHFTLPTDRDHFYIGGLSMGGFGALKCALTYPDRYAGCMSFSARVYMKNKVQQLTKERHEREMRAILGDGMPTLPENDMQLLVPMAAAAKTKPKMYVACGTEDALYPESVQLRGDLEKYGFDLCYEEWPGTHSWGFWREALPRALNFMGLTDDAK